MSDFWIIVLTTVAGFATGVLSGMFGVGGAVISTPAIRALGASPIAAVASTLPSIIPGAISGALRYRRDGLVEVRVAAWTAAAGVFAAVAGALLTDVVPGDGHPLLLLTAVLIAFSAYRLAKPVTRVEEPADVAVEGATDAGPGAERPIPGPRHTEPWRLLLIGLGAGGLSGLLGIGGGLVLVPLFTGWLRLPIKVALGTSLACVAVLAIPGTITHVLLGHIDWLYALPLCIGIVPGARVGSHLAIRSSDRTLRLIVGFGLGTIAVIYFVGELVVILSARSGTDHTRPAPTPDARTVARVRTASSMGSVRRPVKVFCWLGWKQPRIVAREVPTSRP